MEAAPVKSRQYRIDERITPEEGYGVLLDAIEQNKLLAWD